MHGLQIILSVQSLNPLNLCSRLLMYRKPLPVYRNPVILNKLSLKRTSATSRRIQGTAVTWRPEKEGAGSDEVAKETASKVDSISLPPVHLPQKLQDAVGRVLSSKINHRPMHLKSWYFIAGALHFTVDFHSPPTPPPPPPTHTLCSHKVTYTNLT